MAHKNLLKRNRMIETAGFGLIELMVSIGIVVMVMGIIVSKHSSYNGAVLLRSQAYSVALQSREIQLSAVSALGTGTTNYRSILGLHFNTGTPGFYNNFRDADGDHFYDSGEEFGKRNNIDPRFEIGEIRLIGSAVVPSAVSVVFERPNFDARFFTAAGTEPAGVTSVEIDIRLKGTSGSGVGEKRTVIITKTGQITVQSI